VNLHKCSIRGYFFEKVRSKKI